MFINSPIFATYMKAICRPSYELYCVLSTFSSNLSKVEIHTNYNIYIRRLPCIQKLVLIILDHITLC